MESLCMRTLMRMRTCSGRSVEVGQVSAVPFLHINLLTFLGNYGVVTSAVVKAYEPITIATSQFNFQTTPVIGNTTTNVKVSGEVFWKGISAYFSHLVRINDAKGIGWNYIYTAPIPPGNVTVERNFSFVGQVTVPGMSAAQMSDFVAPIIKDLNGIGINITNPKPSFWETYPKASYRANGPGEAVGNTRFISRLFPRSNFENPAAFNASMAAIRTFVDEGGYTFHSVDYHPTRETAGYPGANSAVNPHLRSAIMHATLFDSISYGPETSADMWVSSHARLNSFAQKLRDATPGSGAYMNEADTQEPNFQETFFGDNYDRLYRIKKRRDPWSVFYAVSSVASDEWVVEGTNGLPTQQGRLCRVDV